MPKTCKSIWNDVIVLYNLPMFKSLVLQALAQRPYWIFTQKSKLLYFYTFKPIAHQTFVPKKTWVLGWVWGFWVLYGLGFLGIWVSQPKTHVFFLSNFTNGTFCEQIWLFFRFKIRVCLRDKNCKAVRFCVDAVLSESFQRKSQRTFLCKYTISNCKIRFYAVSKIRFGKWNFLGPFIQGWHLVGPVHLNGLLTVMVMVCTILVRSILVITFDFSGLFFL